MTHIMSAIALSATLLIASSASAAWKLKVQDMKTKEVRTFEYSNPSKEIAIPLTGLKKTKCTFVAISVPEKKDTLDISSINCGQPDAMNVNVTAISLLTHETKKRANQAVSFALEEPGAADFKFDLSWQ